MEQFEAVKSNLDAEIEAREVETSKIEEVKARILKQLDDARRLREGKLTLAEFKALPRQIQRAYSKRFGRPKTGDEQRTAAAKLAKTKRTNKAAKKSRAANRGR